MKQEETALKKKYGEFGKYNNMIDRILANNRDKMNRQVISSDVWSRALQELTGGTDIIMPPKNILIPTKSKVVEQAKSDGHLMSKNLREGLTKKLHTELENWMNENKHSGYLTKKGELRGSMPKSLIEKFESMIREAFKGYTTRDRKLKMPENIHSIAITETRIAVNKTKNNFVKSLKANNPTKKVKKMWIHNDYLVMEPRPGHKKLNGKTLELNKMFLVDTYAKVKGRYIKTGQLEMEHPHDPRAPISEVANCQCELEYVIED